MQLTYDNFFYKAELERRVFQYLAHEPIRDEGTYIQAMVLTGGDEIQAKAKYFELRFRQMIESDQIKSFMVEILKEKGEICIVCNQLIKGEISEIIYEGSIIEIHYDCKYKLNLMDYPTPKNCCVCGMGFGIIFDSGIWFHELKDGKIIGHYVHTKCANEFKSNLKKYFL